MNFVFQSLLRKSESFSVKRPFMKKNVRRYILDVIGDQ